MEKRSKTLCSWDGGTGSDVIKVPDQGVGAVHLLPLHGVKMLSEYSDKGYGRSSPISAYGLEAHSISDERSIRQVPHNPAKQRGYIQGVSGMEVIAVAVMILVFLHLLRRK